VTLLQQFFLIPPPPSGLFLSVGIKFLERGQKLIFGFNWSKRLSFRCALRYHHLHPLGGSHDENPLCQKLVIHSEQPFTKVPGSIPPRNGCSGSPHCDCAGMTHELVDSCRSSESSAQLLWALHGLLESLVQEHKKCYSVRVERGSFCSHNLTSHWKHALYWSTCFWHGEVPTH